MTVVPRLVTLGSEKNFSGRNTKLSHGHPVHPSISEHRRDAANGTSRVPGNGAATTGAMSSPPTSPTFYGFGCEKRRQQSSGHQGSADNYDSHILSAPQCRWIAACTRPIPAINWHQPWRLSPIVNSTWSPSLRLCGERSPSLLTGSPGLSTGQALPPTHMVRRFSTQRGCLKDDGRGGRPGGTRSRRSVKWIAPFRPCCAIDARSISKSPATWYTCRWRTPPTRPAPWTSRPTGAALRMPSPSPHHVGIGQTSGDFGGRRSGPIPDCMMNSRPWSND